MPRVWPTIGIIQPSDISPQGSGSGLDADLLDGLHASQIASPTETQEELPLPEGRASGQSTRVAQTVFNGASYLLRRAITTDRLIFRVTGQAGAPTGRFLIYQTADGGAGVANLVAKAELVAIGAIGNFEVAFTEGIVTLKTGLIYILWGRDSALGSFTLRTYAIPNVDLLSDNMNVNTHPTTFTTIILANTSPATFNPLASGDAIAAIAVDTSGVFRLRKV